jgi:hypothetical protein
LACSSWIFDSAACGGVDSNSLLFPLSIAPYIG